MGAAAESQVIPFAHFDQLREARAILTQEGQALIDLARRLDASFVAAVDLLQHVRGGIIVTGVGKAGLIGRKIAATLASTGTKAYFVHPTEALHGDLGCIGGDDLLLALSNSGETAEICGLLPLVRGRQAPVIAITASRLSTLGRGADVTLELGRLAEAGLHGLAPSTSTTAMLAIGDALALVASQARGFTPQQFATLHPGGSLGRRLTSVRDIMRRGDELRVACDEESIREVLVEHSRPGRRTGAVMLVDADGLLTGLFTDSDLARLLERRRDGQLDRPIREVMTERPLTISPDAILEEVLQVLGGRRVSELPVIDSAGRPVGLIDITDIIGLLPPEEFAPRAGV